MDTREARFLASQAARLADNKRQQKSRRRNQQSIVDNDGIDLPDGDNKNSRDNDTPTNNLIDDENILVNTSDHNHHNNSSSSSRDHKEEGHKFWSNFRKLCSELQCQIDSLLLVTSSDDDEYNNNNSNSNDGDSKKYETAKAYYAIASRRTEGRNLLDSILDNVRLLRKHCLSSSSSMMLLPVTNNDNNNNNDKSNYCHPTNNNNQLLQSILQTPMPEMTSQSDLRLLSDEIDRLLKHIDDVREIISPKEKFIFRRYRLAMEERGRDNIMIGNANAVGVEGIVEEVVDGTNNACLNKMDTEQTTTGETGTTTTTSNDHHYDGGLLENKNDCIIEIYSDGTIKEWSEHELTKEQQQYVQYYGGPRRLNGLHPPTFNNNAAAATTTTTETTTTGGGGNNNSIIMSYLLQNLTNVTILLHGSRPSLHIKNIQNCQIYVTEPTCGPVHVTNCYSSVVRCSCYQLRIHDSIDVKFSVWVRSGPIIENCTKIVFDGSYYCLEMDESGSGGEGGGCGGVGENMYWDVKDFNWLRTLRKSPNYTVVVTDNDNCNDDDGKDDSKGEHTVEANIVEMAPSREEEEGDSEDEL